MVAVAKTTVQNLARQESRDSARTVSDNVQADGVRQLQPVSERREPFFSTGDVEEKIRLLNSEFGIQAGPLKTKVEDKFIRMWMGFEKQWSAEGLDHLWRALESLPLAHLRSVRGIGRIDTGGTTGFEHDRLICLSYADKDVEQTSAGFEQASARRLSERYKTESEFPVDNTVMARGNRLEQVARHEIGHVVLDDFEPAQQYLKTAEGGAWRTFPSGLNEGVTEICRELGLEKALPADRVARVIHAFSHQIYSGWERQLRAERVFPWLAECDADQRAALEHAFEVFNKIVGPPPRYLLGDEDQVVLNGRVYQYDPQAGGLMSYDVAARERRVSNYQMKGPQEWLAEAYAAYFAPDERGVGALLQDRDPATKRWFDENVEKMGGAKLASGWRSSPVSSAWKRA